MAFTTALNGTYNNGQNENALLRWENQVSAVTRKRLVVRVGTEYGIGLASRDDGSRYMDRRWWRAQATADLDPYRRVSSFLLAQVENSYELRIDRRLTAGAGAKLTVYRQAPPKARDTRAPSNFLPNTSNRLDLSLALTGEQNRLPPPDVSAPPTESAPLARSLARLSGRVRFTQRLGERWWFDQVTWFKPELLALHRYNAELHSTLNFVLTRRTQLRLTSQHYYEGSASQRGAKNNRRGTLDMGVSVSLGGRPR